MRTFFCVRLDAVNGAAVEAGSGSNGDGDGSLITPLPFCLSTAAPPCVCSCTSYGFRIQDSEFRVEHLRFIEWDVWCMVEGLVVWAWGVGCKVQRSGFGV